MSKQQQTYDEIFVKCPNNIKVSNFVFNLVFGDDCDVTSVSFLTGWPTIWALILSNQRILCGLNERQVEMKKMSHLSEEYTGQGHVGYIVDLKEELMN